MELSRISSTNSITKSESRHNVGRASSASRSNLQTLNQRKMAMQLALDAIDGTTLKSPIKDLEKLKVVKAAFKKAREELSFNHKRLVSQYTKQAKQLEKEAQSNRLALEMDLRSSAANQRQAMEREQREKRGILLVTTSNSIDALRTLREELERETKLLNRRLETEEKNRRTALEEDILEAKTTAIETVLKKKLAMEVAVLEEYYAVQMAELGRQLSEERSSLELRHAYERGRDMRLHAEGAHCDGNPTISPELEAEQKEAFENMMANYNSRAARLKEHQNGLLGPLFTKFHADMAAVKEAKLASKAPILGLDSTVENDDPAVCDAREGQMLSANKLSPPPTQPPRAPPRSPSSLPPHPAPAMLVSDPGQPTRTSRVSQPMAAVDSTSSAKPSLQTSTGPANGGREGLRQASELSLRTIQSTQTPHSTPREGSGTQLAHRHTLARGALAREGGVEISSTALRRSKSTSGNGAPIGGPAAPSTWHREAVRQAEATKAERARAEAAAVRAKEEREMTERLLAEAAQEESQAAVALAEAEADRERHRIVTEEWAQAEVVAQQRLAAKEESQRAELEADAAQARAEREAAEAEVTKAKAERAMAERVRAKAQAKKVQALQAREEARLASAQAEDSAKQARQSIAAQQLSWDKDWS